jgi:hypothetical protein
VLTHEQCHIKRRDNLTAAIHMIVEAVFWFSSIDMVDWCAACGRARALMTGAVRNANLVTHGAMVVGTSIWLIVLFARC